MNGLVGTVIIYMIIKILFIKYSLIKNKSISFYIGNDTLHWHYNFFKNNICKISNTIGCDKPINKTKSLIYERCVTYENINDYDYNELSFFKDVFHLTNWFIDRQNDKILELEKLNKNRKYEIFILYNIIAWIYLISIIVVCHLDKKIEKLKRLNSREKVLL